VRGWRKLPIFGRIYARFGPFRGRFSAVFRPFWGPFSAAMRTSAWPPTPPLLVRILSAWGRPPVRMPFMDGPYIGISVVTVLAALVFSEFADV